MLALAACAQPPPPNLVLITLDTTRADHLGPYGYSRSPTPNLDRFRDTAVLYERAYATSSWTLPSHASIFTGLLPMQHGAQMTSGDPDPGLGYGVRPLAEHFTTLAERLGEAGYRTAAGVGGPALRRELGVAQGFDHYADQFGSSTALYVGRRAEAIANQAIALAKLFGEEPFFLFVNFFDPHEPYRPPPPHDRNLPEYSNPRLLDALLGRLRADTPAGPVSALEAWERQVLERMIRGYDAEIAYVDLHLGRLVSALTEPPRGDETLIAITSDHGESFGEHHYISHGAHLYEHNIRVPLVIRHPRGRGAGARAHEPFQNHRLFAVFLEAAGVEVPDETTGPGSDTEPVIVTEVQRSDANVRMFGKAFDRDLRAIYVRPYKLIESSTGAVELFDLEADQGELRNLAPELPGLSRSLAEHLERIAAARPPLFDPDERAALTPETEESLRALGYLR
jgi:arylsulfatase A-like enzyme